MILTMSANTPEIEACWRAYRTACLCRGFNGLVAAVSAGIGVSAVAASMIPSSLILLDLHLAGSFDGLDVCRTLRASEATRAVPIIVISAMTDDAWT